MPVAPWQSLRLPPRIDEGYSRGLEISDVAGDHRHAMHEGSSKWAENGFCRSKHKPQVGLCKPAYVVQKTAKFYNVGSFVLTE
jgi:hypothetical protein